MDIYKRLENPGYLAISIRWYKEMGEDAFRKWCDSTISHTHDEYETEVLIQTIKEEISKER